MKYQRGTFNVVPNKEYLKGKPSVLQAVYFWIVDHANEEGECFPKRRTLAREAGCDVKTVDKYLKVLIEEDFLTKTTRIKKGTKEFDSNLYQLLLKDDSLPSVENGITPSGQLGITPSTKNGAVTIPSVTQPNVTIQLAKAQPEEVLLTSGQLPKHRGNTYIIRLVSIYKDLFRDNYGYEPTINIGRVGKELKPLLLTHTELQLSALLISFFTWSGMTGDNDFERSKLCHASHPFAWFFSNLNQYESYLRNVFKLDLDSESATMGFVSKHMSKLNK